MTSRTRVYKVHKMTQGSFPVCGVSWAVESSDTWEPVTCKRCLKKRPKGQVTKKEN